MNLNELIDLNVLIVEDSVTQIMLLKESLESNKLKTVLAKDGVEALEQLKIQLPDVIISDIEMPRMNGYELCQKVKSMPEYKQIPFILLTSLTNPLDVIKSVECGADSFLTKPCDINFLLATILEVIENKKLRKELPEEKQNAFIFNGQRHTLQVNPIQVTDLLLSTYLNALQKNSELESAYKKLNSIYEEIKKKNEELKQLNEVKNQFLGMAAHDLRNPLGVIKGFCSILYSKLYGEIDEKSIKMIENIEHSSTFMLQLINELLDISVIESGTVSLRISEVNLDDVIKECLYLFKELAEKKKITLVYHSDNLCPIIQCDQNKIFQVLSNLITNAIKFSNAGSNVEIFLDSKEQEVILSVKDHGIGIPENAQAGLFQPFTKASVSGTAGEKCTGLGLAIAHKIVQEHKGKIWFESKQGKGTTFHVSLPVSVEALATKV